MSEGAARPPSGTGRLATGLGAGLAGGEADPSDAIGMGGVVAPARVVWTACRLL
ncbi:MAG: hypothetical protein PVG19_10940 [Desulfobacterales bacterium]